MDVNDLPSVDVLGARVHGPTLPQAVDVIETWIREHDGNARTVVATGFHGIWEGHKDPGFRQILNDADLFCPDGIAPVWLSRLQGKPLPARVPGPDLLPAFLERAGQRGYGNYFYGDSEQTLAAIRNTVGDRFPGARIAGTFSPPFRTLSEAEKQEHIDRINAAAPHVLWVGLGCPKQERWICEHRQQLNVPVVIGVGAAFRFLVGRVPRAPVWMQNMGLEWVWRLLAEPRKLWRRDFIDGPRFLLAAMAEACKVRYQQVRVTERP